MEEIIMKISNLLKVKYNVVIIVDGICVFWYIILCKKLKLEIVAR